MGALRENPPRQPAVWLSQLGRRNVIKLNMELVLQRKVNSRKSVYALQAILCLTRSHDLVIRKLSPIVPIIPINLFMGTAKVSVSFGT